MPSWRQVGLKNQCEIDPKSVGRFHIALGTFQEAPERELLIFQRFHWFRVGWGGGQGRRTASGPLRGTKVQKKGGASV